MKTLLSILIVFLISIRPLHAKVYYVAIEGNDANIGSLTLPWKTVTYASANSSAGDTVYVKAGLYNEFVTFSKSGVEGNPIVFLGYRTTPGDKPPLLVNKTDPYTDFNIDDMPTFDGQNRNSRIGFYCEDQKYLVIKNFQIKNYAYGIFIGGRDQLSGNFMLDNVNVRSIGNTSASYSGIGILLGSMGTKFSNNNTITNCLVVNAAAEGFGINGNNNTITGCKVYCNENTGAAATDYYMIITGSYNTVISCYIERALGLSHWGHGFTAKTNAAQIIDQGLTLPAIAAQYNKFYYCEAKNMGESFCVRHRTAQYNLFYHCKATGSHTGAKDSPGGEGNGVVIRDGASDNVFDGIIAENCNAGFVFVDSREDGDMGPNPPGHPGNNNNLINSTIYNCYVGVSFSDEGVSSDAGDNTIANCTFYKTRYLHYARRSCKNMKYIGNIYYGCLPNTPGGYFKGNVYAADIVPNGINTYFKNCNFYNIEGGMPANFVLNSAGSISKDPLFKNPSLFDFRLQPNSPCIDAVDALDYVKFDYDSVARPQGIRGDMGAYESLSTLPVTLTDFKAHIMGYSSLLFWKTASEQNNDRFVIQHSIDGVNFTSVGSVEGHGTSAQGYAYSFTHNNPLRDGLNYYRLSQVDADGHSTLSKIITVRFDNMGPKMSLYPNPAKTKINVSIPANEQKVMMKIYDVNGKMHWSNSYDNPSSLINIDVSFLSSGVYKLIIVNAKEQTNSLTFIKQ